MPIDFQSGLRPGSADSDGLRSYEVFSTDGNHSISGSDLVGFERLTLQNKATGEKSDLGKAFLAAVFDSGVIVKEFKSEGTVTKYVNWDGNVHVLGMTAVDYRLPEAGSTMIQGGASYASPGNCNVSGHFDVTGYAYDFQKLTVGAHVLAVADGLVVYTHGSMTCNQIQVGCVDYSPTGCPGYFLGNQVIILHADGTYSAFSHLQTNSISV